MPTNSCTSARWQKPPAEFLRRKERSRFGHPHASVVNRYLKLEVKLFQTGRDGMVTLETDGATLEFRTYKE